MDGMDRWLSVHSVARAPRPERQSSEDVKPKVERRMAQIDALTPEQRMVVHEFGWNLVRCFLDHGVKSPRAMRALINSVEHNFINRCDRES